MFCNVTWENETFPVSVSCPFKPVDNYFKLFNEAGLWIFFFVKDWGQIFCDCQTLTFSIEKEVQKQTNSFKRFCHSQWRAQTF